MKTTNIFTAIVFFTVMAVSAQKRIEPSELPTGATEFLRQYFPNAVIEIAKKDAEHGEKGYEVILTDGTEIEFWKDGKWREVDGHDKAIPTAFIDAKIVEYVSKNYPDNKITHIDYGHKDVDVDLEGKIDLEFSKDGRKLKGR